MDGLKIGKLSEYPSRKAPVLLFFFFGGNPKYRNNNMNSKCNQLLGAEGYSKGAISS